jgi:copper(I)-binding protein
VTRWNRRLLFGAIAVLVPALAGCEAGFDAPTLAFHPANFGVNTIQNGITIDNAFVLGPAPGSAVPSGGRAGVFLAIQARDGDRLVSVSAPGTASAVKIAGGSVNLPALMVVPLTGPAPKLVLTGLTTPLGGGETVQLSFKFAEAGTITLGVPVEPRAYEYATYAPPAVPNPTTSAQPTPRGTGSVSPFASASQAGGQPTTPPSASASASPSATP